MGKLYNPKIIDPSSEAIMIETLAPAYADLTRSYIGGMLQSNIWAPLDMAIRIKKNFYDTKNITFNSTEINNPLAYNLPGWEADFRASYEVIQNLKITLNYYFANERWSFMYNDNVKMNDINDLNIGVVYSLTPKLSFNLKANNLLGQKYDIWYGHPAQQLNVMGGVSFKF
jgi:outer membrane cobalamin receptor